MKILAVCGNGLGSSFMIEMNVKKVMKEIDAELKAEITHTDLSTARGEKADIYVATRDIAEHLQGLEGEVISLKNMIDIKELKEKLEEVLKKKDII